MSESDTEAISGVLTRYLEIQKQEQALKEEKGKLQESLAAYMATVEKQQLTAEIAGQKLKVRCKETTTIDYNETLLRDRLADRYSTILEPDLRKLRKALQEIAPLLQPVIEQVGSPSPERIRSEIECGRITKEEFAGAFEKICKKQVSVQKLKS